MILRLEKNALKTPEDEAVRSATVRAEERRRRPETVDLDEEHFIGASGGQQTRDRLRAQHEEQRRMMAL